MRLVLTVIAVILVILGINALIHGAILGAIILFIVAALVGPGGYSIFND